MAPPWRSYRRVTSTAVLVSYHCSVRSWSCSSIVQSPPSWRGESSAQNVASLSNVGRQAHTTRASRSIRAAMLPLPTTPSSRSCCGVSVLAGVMQRISLHQCVVHADQPMLHGSRTRQRELRGSGVSTPDPHAVPACTRDRVEGVLVGEVVAHVDRLAASERWPLQQLAHGPPLVH